MTSNTKIIIRQVVNGDVTATEEEKKQIDAALRGKVEETPSEVPRFLSYKEASKKLRRSVSRIRQLVASGRLVPVHLGENRASGVTEASVLALFK